MTKTITDGEEEGKSHVAMIDDIGHGAASELSDGGKDTKPS